MSTWPNQASLPLFCRSWWLVEREQCALPSLKVRSKLYSAAEPLWVLHQVPLRGWTLSLVRLLQWWTTEALSVEGCGRGVMEKRSGGPGVIQAASIEVWRSSRGRGERGAMDICALARWVLEWQRLPLALRGNSYLVGLG